MKTFVGRRRWYASKSKHNVNISDLLPVGSLMQMTSESESVKKKKRAKFLIGIENQYHMAKTQARKDLEDHEYASDTLDVFMTQLKEIGSDEILGYFSENNGRLFPLARLTSYPFPVDTPEQEVGY